MDSNEPQDQDEEKLFEELPGSSSNQIIALGLGVVIFIILGFTVFDLF